MKTLELLRDANGNIMPIIPLSDPQDVVSTGTSVQSTTIDARAARIASVSGDVRFEYGENPEAAAASHFLKEGSEIWIPINPGDKIAILGTCTVNISAIGR
jgi:hypothetical protein